MGKSSAIYFKTLITFGTKYRRARYTAHLILLSCLFSLATPVQAQQVTVAVAANFAATMKQLQPLFEQQSGHHLVASFASTGTLYAQINNGAPFDVFLSADRRRPHQLINDGLAVPRSQFVYATGQLVLWSSQPELIDPAGNILRHKLWQKKGVRHIALANPKTAPYGRAAQQSLDALQLRDATSGYRVTGQNIAQTFQFVVSGNAQLGFIAQAQVLALPATERGSHWVIPANMYQPIQQTAVMLMRGQGNNAAEAFYSFLQTPDVQSIIKARGYR